jgi:hypothetical protein
MQITMKMAAAVLLATALAACGGGGGSPGTTTNGGGTTTTPTTTPVTTPVAQAAVADFALFTDKSTISNSGSDTAKVTVVAVDANRNVVPSAPVTVSTDANSFFVPAGSATDASGIYTGTVQAGGDKTDRDVTVTATVNGIVKRTTVRVTGSKLTLSTPATSVAPGANVVVTAMLRDAAGNPIQGQSVKLAGNIPAATALAAVTTNASGQAVFPAFAAPATVGNYTVSAIGGGTTAVDFTLGVFTAGTVPDAVVPPTVLGVALSATPRVLAVNSAGSTTNRATLRFQWVDNNIPVQNVRVQFRDLSPAIQKTGASLSSTSTLYTDASGTATIQYVAGQNSSATDGVRIRACYSSTDLTAADIANCDAGVTAGNLRFVDALLTVAGQAISVSIGDDNKLATGNGGVTYIKRFAITVADSAGVAVPNANVGISVDLTHYGKGNYTASYVQNGAPVLGLSVVPIGLTSAYPNMTTDGSATAQRVWCPNEDVNRNGSVDPTTAFGGATENYNGSTDGSGGATLDPRKSDLVVSFDDPAVTTTDSTGVVLINVRYAQRFATWLAYKIRVTAEVAGSQGVAERTFVTDFLEADKDNGAFRSPPYGIHSCVAAN